MVGIFANKLGFQWLTQNLCLAVNRGHYLDNKTYAALLTALPNVKPDPITGQLEPHCFAEALGEIGGIWPESVLQDQMREAVGEAA